MNITRRTAAIAAALLVSTACASDVGSSANDPGRKTGGDAAPLTITIADSQPGDKPSPMALAEFESLVEAASDGSIEVETLLEYGSDQEVTEAVSGGDVHMAMVPARAWSTAGVDSMRALQAPFLVQSEPHTDAIVRDPELVDSLFAGLDEVGIHGITMLPEALRHLFSFTTPILTPDDVTGRQIRYLASEEVASMITALGATPVDIAGDEYHELVADGTITAADSSFAIAISGNPTVATGTANLILYPKVVTFVANAAFWDELTDDQRTVLTDAAEAMQDWAITTRVGEAGAAAQYCADGGTVVVADSESVTAFRETVAPIYDELTEDSETAAMIEAIKALTPATAEASVEPCAPTPSTISYNDIVPEGGELPNGVYRVEFTDDYLRSHGFDESSIKGLHGVWTHRLEYGHWSIEQVAPNLTDSWAGIYQVDGDTVYWSFGDPGEGFIALTWSVDADGTLHLTEIEPGDVPDFQFDLPWPRVGDL